MAPSPGPGNGKIMKRSRETLRSVAVSADLPDGSVAWLQLLAAAALLALSLAVAGALR